MKLKILNLFITVCSSSLQFGQLTRLLHSSKLSRSYYITENTLIIMSKQLGFYAVRCGRKPGVYSKWAQCQDQITGFPNASYKKFQSEVEALQFVFGDSLEKTKGPAKGKDDESDGGLISFPMGIFDINTMPEELQPTLLGRPKTKFKGKKDSPLGSLKPQRAKKKSIGSSVSSPIEFVNLCDDSETELCKSPGILQRRQQRVPKENLVNTDPNIFLDISEESKIVLDLHPAVKEDVTRVLQCLKQRLASLEMELSSLKSQTGLEHLVEPPVKQFKLEDDANHLPVPSGMIHVYTDGACTNNGFHGAKAGIGVYWGPNHPLNVSERLPGRQTNNRAEIQAAVKALKQANDHGIHNLTVYTDSIFLINGVTKWVKKWKRNGWKLASGQPVINKDDFEDLENAKKSLNVHWVHVPGHKGIAGNEAADYLATEGIKKIIYPIR